MPRRRIARLVRVVLLIAIFLLGRLHERLSPHAYLWLLAAWVVMCAALTSRNPRLERFLGVRE